MTLRVGSLFSGIGGMDLGLELAGFHTAWQCEIDPWRRAVLAQHWPDIPRYDDVSTLALSPADLPAVDVICGGFPCQDASVANAAGLGINGARTGLWFRMLDIITALQPAGVIGENVPGLLRRGLDVACRGLQDAGYEVEATRLRASDLGFTHRRERVVIVAVLANAHAGGSRARAGSASKPAGWPTPDGCGPIVADTGRRANETESLESFEARQAALKAQGKNGNGCGTPLGVAVRQEWPTPTVTGNHNRKGASPESGDGLATAVQERQLWATATARDSRSGKASAETHARNARPLSEQVGDLLNPDWVELLMGFPSGWTAGVPAAAKSSTRRSRRAPRAADGRRSRPAGERAGERLRAAVRLRGWNAASRTTQHGDPNMNGIPIDVPLPEGLEFRVRPACCYPSDTAGLPEVGYAAYNCGGPTETAGLNYQGLPCPTWPELPVVVVEKWEASAAAIKHVVTADLLRGLAAVLGIEERTPAAVMDAAEELRERVRRLSADPMTFLRTCYSGETDAAAAAALERAINALAGPADPREAVAGAIAQETDPKRLVRLRAALLVLQDEQLAPVDGEGDVWADVIAEERNRADCSEALIAAETARRALGIESYGRTLAYAGKDGRDRKRDTDEETLDQLVYAFSEGDTETVEAARATWLRRNT